MKTANKKYYKRISIEDMDRARLPLESEGLSWSHDNATLVITYKKPPLIMQAEREAKQARLTAPAEDPKKAPVGPDGDVDCKQQ